MAATAAVIGGVIVSTPSPQEAALANWTATPTRIMDDEAAQMMKNCREQLIAPNSDSLLEGEPSKAEVDSMKTVIADRRGNATYGIMLGDGWMADCMTFSETRWFWPFSNYIGSAASMVVRTPTTPVPAEGVSDINRSGMGTAVEPDDPAFATLNGRVGSDVRGVVLHTPEGDVTATVASGWMGAWWPTTWGGVEKWSAGDSSIRVSATLTLSDGSTREIADINEFAWVPPEDEATDG